MIPPRRNPWILILNGPFSIVEIQFDSPFGVDWSECHYRSTRTTEDGNLRSPKSAVSRPKGRFVHQPNERPQRPSPIFIEVIARQRRSGFASERDGVALVRRCGGLCSVAERKHAPTEDNAAGSSESSVDTRRACLGPGKIPLIRHRGTV